MRARKNPGATGFVGKLIQAKEDISRIGRMEKPGMESRKTVIFLAKVDLDLPNLTPEQISGYLMWKSTRMLWLWIWTSSLPPTAELTVRSQAADLGVK